MEQVMLSKIMVSIAKYNAVADDTCASSDQHAQGLMSCCIFLTLLTLVYLISILLYDAVITQSTSTVKCHYYFNHGCTASKLQPVQLLMKNCLKGTNHICFVTRKEATIAAGLGLTICIELGSSSIIITSRCGSVAVHLLFFAQSSSRVQVSNE
jgi:hypothetical protein